MKWTRILVIAALGLGVLPAVAAHGSPEFSAGQWSQETLDKFATIPVQEGGRNKPLDTVARFKLLRLNGMRAVYPEELGTAEKIKRRFTGQSIPKLTPLEWMLDCLFYPEVARDYPNFLVDNSDIVTAIGVEAHDKRRDRYSYNELLPGRQKLAELWQRYSQIEEENRTLSQNQIVTLGNNVLEFETLIFYLDFANLEFEPGDSFLLNRLFEDKQNIGLSDVLAKGPEIIQLLVALRDHGEEITNKDRLEAEMDRISSFFQPLDHAQQTAVALALIPPADNSKREWYSPSDLVDKAFREGNVAEEELQTLSALETMVHTRDNKLAFREALADYRGQAIEEAKEREEYSKIPLEVSFYQGNYFFYAQWLFVLSFILAALSWLSLKNKWLSRSTALFVVIPWVLLIIGITYRCIIRERPPVSTLYETILFITAVVVFVGLFIEWINRQRIAISVAAFLGVVGMFLANKYEMVEKQDTMPSLVAVLDTNFWLSTHVTTVTTGYAAGLLAAAVAHVYILAKLFKLKWNDKAFYRNLTRMVYGIVCFGLFFSFIGTVLGGIWANYSWGRFWGWDPKENGALMIVLWNLAIIHSRFGGLIKQDGMHMMAIGGGMIVAFSWWGVNNLGVGLHSYGFTDGVWGALYLFWSIQSAVLLLGCAAMIRDYAAKQSKAKQDAGDSSSEGPPDDAEPVTK